MNKRKNNSVGYVEIKIYIIDHCFEMPFDRSNSSKIYLLVIAIKTDQKTGTSIMDHGYPDRSIEIGPLKSMTQNVHGCLRMLKKIKIEIE